MKSIIFLFILTITIPWGMEGYKTGIELEADSGKIERLNAVIHVGFSGRDIRKYHVKFHPTGDKMYLITRVIVPTGFWGWLSEFVGFSLLGVSVAAAYIFIKKGIKGH